MTDKHAKGQGQRLVGSKVEVDKANGRTDGDDCIIFRANAIGKYIVCSEKTLPFVFFHYFLSGQPICTKISVYIAIRISVVNS